MRVAYKFLYYYVFDIYIYRAESFQFFFTLFGVFFFRNIYMYILGPHVNEILHKCY